MRMNKMNMTKVGMLGFAKQKNEDDKRGGWVLQNKRMNMNRKQGGEVLGFANLIWDKTIREGKGT
jgi:hypothetical protein